ncbi:N-acetylglucosamine-6-phosphate deacetylase [Spirochaetia bacterium]|nr:N-acetylglucosamine-6-phosphate deacetylase [Spirochaetia bacterium]GHU37090.1 N-acetylglucosamine-6-phosphate deacetylase [Spirochaetia bacterium]
MGSICLRNGSVMTGVATMEHCAVLIEDGLIADVFSQKRFEQKHFDSSVKIIDVDGAYIAPGFIDTHIHGFGGYGTEDSSPESLLEISQILSQYGVTAFNPTLYPAEAPLMLNTIRSLSSAIGKETGAQIMGLHLEGPFISPDRLGVMKPETLSPVDISFMEKLWNASSGRIINMTVAPELKGMRELALYCIKKGIILQAGHTNAQYENMLEGMQAGILHSTHLFNAMSKLDHRNPNAVGAILTHPEFSCEIIADGWHVHPDLFKLLARDKSIEKIVLVTDSLKPTEQKHGPFFANGEGVCFRDGVFHRTTDDIIAGSALTMITGIRNLVTFGFSLEDAVRTATSNPAQIMHYSRKGAIMPGYDADLAVFDSSFNILLVAIHGDIKKNTF